MIHWLFRRRGVKNTKTFGPYGCRSDTRFFGGRKWKILRSRNCEGSSQLTCFRETAASYDLDTPPKTNRWNLNKKAPWKRKKKSPQVVQLKYVVIFNFDLRIFFRMGRKRKTPTTNNQPILGGFPAVSFVWGGCQDEDGLSKGLTFKSLKAQLSWEFVQIGNP